MKSIAVVEDEDLIRENYMDALSRYGYQVNGYRNRREASLAFSARLPHLAIIDISLEDEVEGGFELCRELRQRAPDMAIIFLTARDSDLDIISGLRLGADDYLTKEISLPQLLARITALFRRIDALTQAPERETIELGALRLEIDTINAYWNNLAIPLTVTEFWLLHALVKYPGHVKSRDQLMQAANTVIDHSSINSHIKRIRQKFKTCDERFDAIESVYGAGYRWLKQSD